MASPPETKRLPTPWPEGAEIKVHTGGCHCKKIRYEFEHPDIYAILVTSCNCSICEQRGYLNVYTWEDKFRFTKGSAEDLTTYMFGDCKVGHRFCTTCGSGIGATFHSRGYVVINTRTIDGIDLKRLELRLADGRSKD
ncbi:Mss4-like protein [Mycena capillaripes]|nr:Mss4-like protein [Mycena capillaripes]